MTIDISIDGVSLQDLAAQVRLIERSQLDMAELVGGELDTTKARVAALEELVASMKAALDDTNTDGGQTPPVVVPPVVVDPPVVVPPLPAGLMPRGNVLFMGPSWTLYLRQVRDLVGSDVGWGRFFFGMLGTGNALTVRDAHDGMQDFGETIDSLAKASRAPGAAPFSMSANPAPKLPYGIEAARPGHAHHGTWLRWSQRFWSAVAAEQKAGRLPKGVLFALGHEMTGWYPAVGSTAAYSIHPSSNRDPDVYGYWFAAEQRNALEAGAVVRCALAPNTPTPARQPLLEAVVKSIRNHGGRVDVASMSYYTYQDNDHYPKSSSSKAGTPLDVALDYMAKLCPGAELGINETGVRRGQFDRVRKAVEVFEVATEYECVNVNLFCANKKEGDYRVFDDGTGFMTAKEREERAQIVEAANAYISKVRA